VARFGGTHARRTHDARTKLQGRTLSFGSSHLGFVAALCNSSVKTAVKRL